MNTTITRDPPARSYETRGGITIRASEHRIAYADAVEPLVDALNERRGALFTSSFEYPGRYTRWDMGFVDPPLAFSARERSFRLEALNERGRVLLPAVAAGFESLDLVDGLHSSDDVLAGVVIESGEAFPEELRSKRPTVFSVLRRLIEMFHSPDDAYLGLYGAFGYELAFQFEPVRRRLQRQPDQRDLVLYLPDEVLIVDHRRESAITYRYEFGVDGRATVSFPERALARCSSPAALPSNAVTTSRASMRTRSDAQSRRSPGATYSRWFRAKHSRKPVPRRPRRSFADCAVETPPRMVRSSIWGHKNTWSRRPRRCTSASKGGASRPAPISGTIARGEDAIGDSHQIRELLNSVKEESELTMCTDVDRNDKSRVCEPGSVRIIGRRQIEIYSRLIHTVDHVEGRLRNGYDALDGFLAHTWAVTVTGAPKQHAIQFIEDHERSARRWYGGAIGMLGFDGNMNTGLTLRTVRIANGIAEVRAGATLLFESEPDAEERETRLKASALIDAILRPDDAPGSEGHKEDEHSGRGKRIIMVDHEDSFVHTLAGYFRETGAEVDTYRSGFPLTRLDVDRPELVLLSPGPGRPADFSMGDTIAAAIAREIPIFGVCLGLQGIVEHFGGTLGTLSTPVHGKPSRIRVRSQTSGTSGRLFEGLAPTFLAGRYHSLFAVRESLPAALEVTAESEDGIVMAIEHRELPIAAVQFHPESLMSLDQEFGRALIHNVVRLFCR